MPAVNEILIQEEQIAALQALSGNTAVSDDCQDLNLVPTERNNNMALPIYHFLMKWDRPTEDEGTVPTYLRVMTTRFLNSTEEKNYNDSVKHSRIFGGIFAIKSGNYAPVLLQERLANKGVGFRLTVVENKDTSAMGGIKTKVMKHNFAWANPNNTFYLDVEGDFGWGLHSLGMDVDFMKKTPKRLQEIGRSTAHALYSENERTFIVDSAGVVSAKQDFLFTRTEDLPLVNSMDRSYTKWVIAEFETPEGDHDAFYDGMNAMSKQMARALGFDATRGQIRVNCKRGVIKGDFVVASRQQLGGADLVVHTENIKGELRTNGWVLITASEHAPQHVATLDHQSMINNPAVFAGARMLRDIAAMKADAENLIVNLPDWMFKIPEAHDDSSGIKAESVSGAAVRDIYRWQMFGRDNPDYAKMFEVYGSQNLHAQGMTGFTGRMERGLTENKLFKKVFLPLTNAFNGSVIAWSAATKLAGFDLSHLDPNKVHMHVELGVIIPDKRFLDTYDLHGTWDQDDTADFIRVKIWSSSAKAVALLVGDKVLPDDVEIPTTAEEAIEAVVVIRSPNGPGEYSIEFMGSEPEDTPYFSFSAEGVDVINLNTMPRGQTHLLTLVNKRGLPEPSLTFGGAMTREQAIYMIEAQTINPGIGRLANAMMAWVNSVGVSFPIEMTDVFGEMVDVTEQEFDKVRLLAVSMEHESVLNQLAQRLIANPKMAVDRLLYTERLKGNTGDYMEVIESRLQDGIPTALSNEYKNLYLYVRDEIKRQTLETRTDSALRNAVVAMPVGVPALNWAKEFERKWTGEFARINGMYKVQKGDHKYVKISKSFMLGDAIREAVNEMVAALQDFETPGQIDRHVMALYKHLVIEHPNWPNGYYDQVMFRSGGLDVSPMSMFAEAIIRRVKV